MKFSPFWFSLSRAETRRAALVAPGEPADGPVFWFVRQGVGGDEEEGLLLPALWRQRKQGRKEGGTSKMCKHTFSKPPNKYNMFSWFSHISDPTALPLRSLPCCPYYPPDPSLDRPRRHPPAPNWRGIWTLSREPTAEEPFGSGFGARFGSRSVHCPRGRGPHLTPGKWVETTGQFSGSMFVCGGGR